MQAASCVVCQERINLLAQKLVTVQWVDGRSGTLLSLTFHSDCYVRWYGETAKSAQKAAGEAQPKKEPPLATVQPKSAPPAPPAETPERHLTPDELKRLEQLRGKRDTDAAPAAPRALGAGNSAGSQAEERDHQDDHAPDDEQPKDGHDVAPPDV